QKQTSVTRTVQFGNQLRGFMWPGNRGNNEQTDTSETFQLDFTVTPEPRLPVLWTGEPTLAEAVDDKNRSLALAPERDGPPGMAPRMMAMQMRARVRGMRPFRNNFGMDLSSQVALKPPEKDARTVKIIRGTVPVYLEKEKKTLVV